MSRSIFNSLDIRYNKPRRILGHGMIGGPKRSGDESERSFFENEGVSKYHNHD